ncbi:hypothetical protein [Sporomusa sp. KB1]|uniref:hypothetical protein n=1 Tax=Sporomusa sp. KB1 TaxID=943346 RepID=UPI0011A473E1|nr:hypothetical protein [Sporomusa sp. KB1]TWH45715.1 hypothetical protein Salpa_1635 [Sporomusa sp. KB1]
MLERIHANSDILTSGKIMLLVDCEPGCYTLTDLEYSEHTLQELLVDTHKAIQEAISTKNDFTFEAYVTILVSLTDNIKNITESLLTIKAAIQAAKSEQGTIISESYQKERVSILQNCKKIAVNHPSHGT